MSRGGARPKQAAGNGGRARSRASRPFRSAAIFYGVLSLLGFGFLLLTGQSAPVAAGGAAIAFVLATGWSWWRFARHLRAQNSRR